jgi:putative Mn2+ efflux pump MntP
MKKIDFLHAAVCKILREITGNSIKKFFLKYMIFVGGVIMITIPSHQKT